MSENGPLGRDEQNEFGSDELLQRPASVMPEAVFKRGRTSCFQLRKVGSWDIPQKGVADGGEGVVTEHGIDGLGKIGTRGFVDAAGVDPDPRPSMLGGKQTALPDLVPDAVARIRAGQFALFAEGLEILECVFMLVPDVREDGISSWDVFWSHEKFELCAVCAKKPHLQIVWDNQRTSVWRASEQAISKSA